MAESYNFSAQYLLNYACQTTGKWGVNRTIVKTALKLHPMCLKPGISLTPDQTASGMSAYVTTMFFCWSRFNFCPQYRDDIFLDDILSIVLKMKLLNAKTGLQAITAILLYIHPLGTSPI